MNEPIISAPLRPDWMTSNPQLDDLDNSPDTALQGTAVQIILETDGPVDRVIADIVANYKKAGFWVRGVAGDIVDFAALPSEDPHDFDMKGEIVISGVIPPALGAIVVGGAATVGGALVRFGPGLATFLRSVAALGVSYAVVDVVTSDNPPDVTGGTKGFILAGMNKGILLLIAAGGVLYLWGKK
jgi:hypothetical protein